MEANSSHICRIESVETTDNAVYVDAQHMKRPSVVFRNTPLLVDFSGVVAVPQVGQRVIVSKDSSGFEYVDGMLTGPDDPPPELESSEYVLQFDPSTRISFTKDGAGGFDVGIEASGDVDVVAGGDIRVGENGESVALQNHTHEYDDDDGSTTTSKTTSTPNESGTNTTIQ